LRDFARGFVIAICALDERLIGVPGEGIDFLGDLHGATISDAMDFSRNRVSGGRAEGTLKLAG
jgi:hypothetical protein